MVFVHKTSMEGGSNNGRTEDSSTSSFDMKQLTDDVASIVVAVPTVAVGAVAVGAVAVGTGLTAVGEASAHTRDSKLARPVS